MAPHLLDKRISRIAVMFFLRKEKEIPLVLIDTSIKECRWQYTLHVYILHTQISNRCSPAATANRESSGVGCVVNRAKKAADDVLHRSSYLPPPPTPLESQPNHFFVADGDLTRVAAVFISPRRFVVTYSIEPSLDG